MIPKPKQAEPKPITVKEAEQLIDDNIGKNGGLSALVDLTTVTPKVLAKLRAIYSAGNWSVNIATMRDGRTTRFRLS